MQSIRAVATGSMACLSHQATSLPKQWMSLWWVQLPSTVTPMAVGGSSQFLVELQQNRPAFLPAQFAGDT
jgi:hypothetical protein